MRSLAMLLLLLFATAAALLGATFWRNGLPWRAPPGVFARFLTYMTTHVAETVASSAFPELHPRRYADVTPDQLYGYVEQAVGTLAGWRIVQRDRVAHVLRVEVTTPIAHFQDDLQIAVAPDGSGRGAVLKIRAESRIGQGDLGTNTAHILHLYGVLDHLVPPPAEAPGTSPS